MLIFNLFNSLCSSVYSLSTDSIEKPLNLFNEDRYTKVQTLANYAKEFNMPSPLGSRYDSWVLPLHKKYRSTFEIISLVLEAVKAERATSYPMMRYAGINCTQLKKYLKSLIDIGFVVSETDNGNVYYKATERGLEFLSQYYVLLGMLLSTPSKEKHISSSSKRAVSPVLQRKM